MLLYFTSGTTGYPKMVVHEYSYSLAHMMTAKHWHNINPDGLHLTVSETGWAKAAWGKIYGQWLMRGGIFVYDFNKFIPEGSAADGGKIPYYHILRAADHLPVLYQRGNGQLRCFFSGMTSP